MAESEDMTLELNELRAALLAADEDENQEPLWANQNAVAAQPGDETFLRLVANMDIDRTIDDLSKRVTQIRGELSAAALSLAPLDRSAGEAPHPFAIAPVDGVETLAKLQSELDACAVELAGKNSLAHYEASELEARQLREVRLGKIRVLLNALEKLALFQRRSDEFDSAFNSGDVVQAAKLVLSLDELSSSISKVAESSNKQQQQQATGLAASQVAKAVRSQCRSRRAFLQTRLEELLSDAIVFDLQQRVLIIRLEARSERVPAPVSLDKVLEALSLLGGLVSRLQERLVKPLNQEMLKYVFENASAVKIEQDLSNLGAPSLRVVAYNNEDKSGLAILDSVQTAMRFIWSEALGRQTELNAQVNAFSGIESLLREAIRNAIPSTFEELENFRSQSMERAARFDSEMERIGFKPSEKLVNFVSDAESNFASKLRATYADKIRQSARAGDLLALERVDAEKEPPFIVGGKGDFAVAGDTRISRFARKVARTAEAALEEARGLAQTSTICTEALVKSARSSFDLFRALAGPLRREEMQTNPRLAMVHRNDCEYLAQHCVTLALRYRSASGLEGALAVDVAPYLFDEAEEVAKREAELRCEQVRDSFRTSEKATDASGIDFGAVLARADAILAGWGDALSSRRMEHARTELAEALSMGAFHAVCASKSAIGLAERRTLLKKLTNFGEAVRARGGSSKRIEQMCKALQPHMSLYPLFVDLVEAELADWPPESLVAFAHAVFGKTSTKEELQQFEEKMLYY